MLRVRVDGGQLSLGPAAGDRRRSRPEFGRRHRRHRPTGRTSSCTGSGSRTCRTSGRRLEAGRAAVPPRPAATARGWCWAARSPGWPTTRCSTRRRRSTRSWRRFVGDKRVLQPAAQVQVVGVLAAPTCPYRGQRHLVPRRRCTPSTGPASTCWVGGGLSTNPMLAQRLGVWVPLDEVAEVWAGVVGIFRDYGYRRLRHRARLKFLVADWGVERFREVLERSTSTGRCWTVRRRTCRPSRSTTSACTGSATAATTSAPRRSSVGSTGHGCSASWPTWPRRTAAAGVRLTAVPEVAGPRRSPGAG